MMTEEELAAVSKFCTPCPGCNTLIELKEGCKKISCNCGTKFCHHCGKQLLYDIHIGSYYNHICEKPNNKVYDDHIHDAFIEDIEALNDLRAIQQIEQVIILDQNPCHNHKMVMEKIVL